MFNIFLRFVICVLIWFRKITQLVHLRLISMMWQLSKDTTTSQTRQRGLNPLHWVCVQDPPCCIENVIWCDEEGLTLLSMSVFFFPFDMTMSGWQVIAMSKLCFRGDKKGPLPPCHICSSILTWEWGMPLLAMLKITVATLLQTINVFYIFL